MMCGKILLYLLINLPPIIITIIFVILNINGYVVWLAVAIPSLLLLVMIILILLVKLLFYSNLIKKQKTKLATVLKNANKNQIPSIKLVFWFFEQTYMIWILYFFIGIVVGLTITSKFKILENWTFFIAAILIGFLLPLLIKRAKMVIEYPEKFHNEIKKFYDSIAKLKSLYISYNASIDKIEKTALKSKFYFELSNIPEILTSFQYKIKVIIRFEGDPDKFEKYSKNIINKLSYYEKYVEEISKYFLYNKKYWLSKEYLFFLLINGAPFKKNLKKKILKNGNMLIRTNNFCKRVLNWNS